MLWIITKSLHTDNGAGSHFLLNFDHISRPGLGKFSKGWNIESARDIRGSIQLEKEYGSGKLRVAPQNYHVSNPYVFRHLVGSTPTSPTDPEMRTLRSVTGNESVSSKCEDAGFLAEWRSSYLACLISRRSWAHIPPPLLMTPTCHPHSRVAKTLLPRERGLCVILSLREPCEVL